MSDSSFPESWGDFLSAVRRRSWIVWVFAGFTLAAVVVLTLLQTPVYRSAAAVLIDMEQPSVLSISRAQDESTVAQTNYLTYADYYRTQLEIITSRPIAEQVFRNLKLDEREEPFLDGLEEERGMEGVLAALSARLRSFLGERPRYMEAADPVEVLREQVKVEPVKQTRLVRILVEDSDPEWAARIGNEFAAVFAAQNLDRTRQAESVNLLKNESMKLRARLAELSKRYGDKHPAMLRIREEIAELESTPAQNSRPNNIQIQSPATPPPAPVRPNKTRDLLLGLLFGFLGGMALAVWADRMDPSLRSSEDVERNGRSPLLGTVPKVPGFRLDRERRCRRRALLRMLKSRPDVVEAYRAIRTHLMYPASGEVPQAVVVTSAQPGEGKTTSAACLSVLLAQSGVTTLLVDADLRRGKLHWLFSREQKPGLGDYLSGRAPLEEVIRETDVPGLFLIPRGAATCRPTEWLGSSRMQDFVAWAESHYDVLLLDTPPLEAVSDAAVTAALAQNVILVAQSGRTPAHALRKLAGMCGRVGAHVLGVVLNGVSHSGPHYDYEGDASYSARPGKGAMPLDLEQVPRRVRPVVHPRGAGMPG